MGITADYNIVDEFLNDFDDLLYNEDTENTDNLNNYLFEHHLNLQEVRNDFYEFMTWFNKMMRRIGASKVNNKALICRCFIKYMESHDFDENLIRLWCIFFCDNSDFLFINFDNKFYEEFDGDEIMEHSILCYLKMKEEYKEILDRIKADKLNSERFAALASKITFTDELCTDCDFTDFVEKLKESIDISDNYIDNLTLIIDKISHSPQLSQIIPLVLNLIFIRRSEKMHSEGFEPNYRKILEYYKYKIDKNNRKNIDSFENQISSYIQLRDYFDCCDPALCDAGFNAVSNIVDCSLIDWEQYPELRRPLLKELSENYFSCFVDGYYENPYYTSKNINIYKLMRFNAFDMSASPECRISENMYNYLKNNSELSDSYYKLLENGEQDKCMSIIMRAAVNSGVAELITSKKADYAYTEIIECIHMDISRRICEELLAIGEKIINTEV